MSPQVFSEYFKELEEESIRDNFVIIYELMDELMDFGYPQTTDSKILQECVFSPCLCILEEIQRACILAENHAEVHQKANIHTVKPIKLYYFLDMRTSKTGIYLDAVPLCIIWPCRSGLFTNVPRYITQEGHKLDTGASRPPATVTNAVSWRSEGIKYRKNEVFLDVIESVNLLVRNVCFSKLSSATFGRFAGPFSSFLSLCCVTLGRSVFCL